MIEIFFIILDGLMKVLFLKYQTKNDFSTFQEEGLLGQPLTEYEKSQFLFQIEKMVAEKMIIGKSSLLSKRRRVIWLN